MSKITRRRIISAVGAITGSSILGKSRASFSQPRPTGDGGISICELWVTNSDRTLKRWVPVELGVPVAPGITVSSGTTVAVSEGQRRLPCQMDNLSTDSGHQLRWFLLTVLLPTLGPSESKRLQVSLHNDRSVVRAGISATDLVTRVPDASVELLNVVPLSEPNSLRARASDGLRAQTAWEIGKPQRHGAWRLGPVCSEHIVSVPFTGQTVHPHLRAWFHLAAYSDGDAVVNSRATFILENGYSIPGQRNNRSYFYDFKINFGEKTLDYSTVDPIGDISINDTTISRTTGAFSDEQNGLFLFSHDRLWAARLVVPLRNRSNQARIVKYGSVPTGIVRPDVRNVGHSPFTRWTARLWQSPPGVFAHLAPIGWGGPAEAALGAYCKATKMIQNFTMPTPNAYTTDALDAIAARPFAMTTPGSIGHFSASQGSPGDNPDIGAHPSYYLVGLFNHTPAGQRQIVEHGHHRQGAAAYLRNSSTGQFHRPDEGPDLHFDMRWGQSYVGAVDGIRVNNQYWAISHWGAHFYIPYLVTGEFTFLEGLVAQNLYSWISSRFSTPDNRICGNGMSRHDANVDWPQFYDSGAEGKEWPQPREAAWAVRTSVHTLALFPDAASPSLLGWDKAMARRLWENVQNNLFDVFVTNSTGEGKRWTGRLPEVRRLVCEAGQLSVQWMEAMNVISWAHGAEVGVLNQNGLEFTKWLMEGRVSPLNDPKFNSDFMISLPDWTTTIDGKQSGPNPPIRGIPRRPILQGEPVRTPEDVYAATVSNANYTEDLSVVTGCTILDPSTSRPISRTVAGQVVRIKTDRPVFMQPHSWYERKIVSFHNFQRVRVQTIESTDQFLGRVEFDMRPEWARSDGRWSNFRPCFPPPGAVQRGTLWMPAGGEEDWAGYLCDLCAHAVDLDVAGAREAWQYMINLKRTRGGGRFYFSFKHSIQPR